METLFIRPPAPTELLPQNAELPNPQEALDLVALNARFRRLDPFNRVLEVFGMFRPEEILVTSSFGITSGVLLGMVSKAAPGHPVHFIDTTYHFPETLAYKERLRERLRLNIVTLRPDPTKNAHSRDAELWKTAPDDCCHINKVEALEPVKKRHRVWISGLMADQSDTRRAMGIFSQKPGDLLKFHPFLDWSQYEALLYLMVNELPHHPLMEQGYDSVGCTHCTQPGECRMGRWAQFVGKTECGLHL